MHLHSLLAACILLAAGPAAAADSADYVRDVKPLLAARCYACHGALQQKSGLRVDTAAALLKGGDRGPAVLPGKSAASLLLHHVTATQGARRMPPRDEGEHLSEREVGLLRAWVDQGAKAPADERPEPDPRDHWAFRTPVRPLVPAAKRTSWVRNPVDAFLAAEHERLGLTPQPRAEKGMLLRRVYLDLVGLPPTREELAVFVADPSPDAYDRVVERLLASPQYGERWGRHWMDVWRYSDWWGLGTEVRNSQKHIWHWRDWILASLNADKGYDQMLREMVAADELYPTDLEKLRATGYLARSYFKFNRNTWLDEVVEHTGKAFLGLTLNCAKCHDHKYDPIGQADYYRLRAFFEPYQVRTDQLPGEIDLEKNGLPRVFDCNLTAPTYLFVRGNEQQPRKEKPLLPGLPPLLALGELKIEPVELPAEAHTPGLRAFVLEDHLHAAAAQTAAARAALDHQPAANPLARAAAEKALATAESLAASVRYRAAADRARLAHPPAADAADLARRAARAERQVALNRAAEAVARSELDLANADDKKKPELQKKLLAARDLLTKAQKTLDAPGDTYTPLRGALKTLESNVESEASRSKPFPRTSTGRRTALAHWITDKRHPLTARVAVNHLWLRHFGRPLVPTVFDFGRKGTPPTHPELLDWLAVELRESGWSLKHLHRLMVTSSAYCMTSSGADNPAADRENRWYWRMNPTRMEAQVVRDSLLHLAGELDLAQGGPPVPVNVDTRRRSLYYVHSHNDHQKFLAMFDDAPVQECYRRAESIVPQQALALANSRLALDTAQRIAARLSTAADADFIRAAFERILAAPPTAAEHAESARAMAELVELLTQQKQPNAPQRARAMLVQALLNHSDFVTIR